MPFSTDLTKLVKILSTTQMHPLKLKTCSMILIKCRAMLTRQHKHCKGDS